MTQSIGKINHQTKTYRLQLELFSQVLKISLNDLIDGINYYRQYTVQDIGKQINYKMSIQYIYNKLKKCGETYQELLKGSFNYQFGIIYNSHNRFFKIQKGGKLTVYLESQKDGRYVCYGSNLVLNRRDGNQKYVQKLFKEPQIQKVTSNKPNNIQKDKKQVNEKLMNRVLPSKQQIKKDGVIKSGIKVIQADNQLKLNKKILSQSDKSQQNNKPTIQVIFNQPFYQSFRKFGNIIEYIGQYQWTKCVINDKIPFDKEYQFKIQINRSSHNNIMVGVFDNKYLYQNRSEYQGGHALCYYGCVGLIYPINSQQGVGFIEGQTVQVIINRQKKQIRWLVASVLRARCFHDLLGVQTRELMPYIEMQTHGDVVQWC